MYAKCVFFSGTVYGHKVRFQWIQTMNYLFLFHAACMVNHWCNLNQSFCFMVIKYLHFTL